MVGVRNRWCAIVRLERQEGRVDADALFTTICRASGVGSYSCSRRLLSSPIFLPTIPRPSPSELLSFCFLSFSARILRLVCFLTHLLHYPASGVPFPIYIMSRSSSSESGSSSESESSSSSRSPSPPPFFSLPAHTSFVAPVTTGTDEPQRERSPGSSTEESDGDVPPPRPVQGINKRARSPGSSSESDSGSRPPAKKPHQGLTTKISTRPRLHETVENIEPSAVGGSSLSPAPRLPSTNVLASRPVNVTATHSAGIDDQQGKSTPAIVVSEDLPPVSAAAPASIGGATESKPRDKEEDMREFRKGHTDDSLICSMDECSTDFAAKDKTWIRKHLLSHFEKKSKELQCKHKDCLAESKTMSRQEFFRHVESEHLGWKYSCPDEGCQRRYARYDSLKNHWSNKAGVGRHMTCTHSHLGTYQRLCELT